MQTQVRSQQLQAVEGMLANSIHDCEIHSRIASGVVYAGKAVTPYATTEVNPNLQRSKLPASAAQVALCEGVAKLSDTLPQTDGVNHSEHASGSVMEVVKKGEIWVVSGNQITDLSKPVYVRHSNGNLVQVFTLTLQNTAAVDKVYDFNIIDPDGTLHNIRRVAVGTDEDVEATAIAALIDAIDGITAAAVSTVITCTADTADEHWQVQDLEVADIVLAGETSQMAGTAGSFRSTADAVQTLTITLADTAASGKLYPLVIRNKDTGAVYAITHTATGTDEDAEATAIAALINAFTGIGAAAVSNVITCTAANLDEEWEITGNADMAVADTTATNYARWAKAQWVASATVGNVWMGKLRINN